MTDTFLSPEDMADLTGVRTGRSGKTREERQIEWLRTSGIPFWVNARGRPVVARAAVEGRTSTAPEPVAKGWTPRVLSAR